MKLLMKNSLDDHGHRGPREPRILVQMGFIMLCLISFLYHADSNAATNKTVYVITHEGSEVYDAALKGFKDTVSKSDLPPDILVFDYDTDKEAISNLKSSSPQAVLVIGTKATSIAVQELSPVPIVFTAVLAPISKDLQAANVTGTLLNIPYEMQFSLLKQILPSLKNIGVLYNPQLNTETVKEAQEVARTMGLNLDAKAVENYRDIIPTLGKWLSEIDFLWFIADTVVCQPANVKHLLLECLKMKKPVMGLSPAFVKIGAIVAMTCDYEDIGKQSGEIMLRVLRGEQPSQIKAYLPRKTRIYLNLNIARTLKIDLPHEVIKNAAEIYGK